MQKLNEKYGKLADEITLKKTVEMLIKNGINAEIVENGEEAKAKVLEMLPAGAEVMTMTSVTLDTIGVSKEINESGKYDVVRDKLYAMDHKTQALEMQKLGAAPEWAIGSVHAVTQDGKILVASNSGSQIPAYVYGSAHVIWVVGAQKVVENTEDGLERLYEYSLPLEDERAKKAYGVHSNVSKIMILNKEIVPNRIHLIFVREKLGF